MSSTNSAFDSGILRSVSLGRRLELRIVQELCIKGLGEWQRIVLEIEDHIFLYLIHKNQVVIEIFDSWCRTIRSKKEAHRKVGLFCIHALRVAIQSPN